MTVDVVTGVHYVTGFHRSTRVILIITMNRYFSRGKLTVAHVVKKNSTFMEPYSSRCGKQGSLMATKRSDILQISGKFQSSHFIIEPVTSRSSSHRLFPNTHFSIIFPIFIPSFYVLYVCYLIIYEYSGLCLRKTQEETLLKLSYYLQMCLY